MSDSFVNVFLQQSAQDFIRIAAAIILGMLVGFEREIRDKPAGLRTMILICVGACVFAMVSEKMGREQFVDRTRIAAQIVTGVGFLGAGAILRGRRAVHGLTTAAAIWMVAAVGMACGFGQFGIAIVGTLAIIIVLMFFQFIGSGIERTRETRKYRIATADKEIRFTDLDPMFEQANLHILARNVYRDGGHIIYTFRVRGHTRHHLELREQLTHSERFHLRK